MNAETVADPNLIQKGKRKKKKHKIKKTYPGKFDKEGFLIAWGLAIVFAVIGIYINNWAIETPEGTFNANRNNISNQLVGFFPESGTETVVFILGSLFMFGAIICIFIGLKIVVQYIVGKKIKYRRPEKSIFLNEFRKLFPN